MPNSFSQPSQQTCPKTGKPFTFDVWLIVDTVERPDLLQKMRDETLHVVTSPYTGDELGSIDAPLLIFQPDKQPPLLFSPAKGTTQEQDQQQARGLVQSLRRSLGERWQEGWLQDGLSGIERQMLPVALSDNPEAELKRRAEEIQAALEKLKGENPEEYDRVMRQLEQARQEENDESEANEQNVQAQIDKLKTENPEEYNRLMKLQAAMQRLAQSDDAEAEMEKFKAEDPELHQQLLELMESMQNQRPSGDNPTDDINAIIRELQQPPRDARDMPRRVELCRRALALLPRQGNEQLWAALQGELGNTLAQNPHGDRAQNIEDAIAAYQQALTVRTQTAMPVDWATTMMNLATAYYSRIRGDRAQNIEDAIAAYQQALEVRTREAFPAENRDTLRNLVTLYFGERRWAQAYHTCQNAIAVGGDIFAAGIGDAGRMDALKQTGSLYTLAAYSALQLGQTGEALSLIEAGKARLLAEAQSLGDANLTQLDAGERQRLQSVRERIRALEYEYRLAADAPARRDYLSISHDLADARSALRRLVAELRTKDPNFMPEGLPLDELLALMPEGSALVAPLFTSQGSAVFIVPGGTREVTGEHVLMLDDITEADLYALTREAGEKPGWLRYYINYRFAGAGMKALFAGIDKVTRRLWDAFVRRMHERLQALGIKRVLLMPQGDTALVPLHAAWREVDGARRYFIDDYAITYVTSMRSLAAAKHQQANGSGALVAGVSQYKALNNLPNTRAEAESIAALFGVSALIDGAASVDAIRQGAKGKAYIHLSCHGGFGWGGDAFASALYVADDAPLPLPQIMAQLDLSAARLVVLSACETGIVDFDNVPDEFVGLPAGFMQAGAAAVISSLWTVEDRSTALLMERMYKYMLDKDKPMDPAVALRAAQFWLRGVTAAELGEYYESFYRMSDSEAREGFRVLRQSWAPDDKPYAHPYYWAAFKYDGA
ncbi:MAG: CHAT domain-containing protein [Chloroflexota bacterium]|nr:CHAT domain-containing protein [Chloroflexota bacterium]